MQNRLLAKEGAIVYANDIKEGSMDEWVNLKTADNNQRINPVYFDITDSTAVKNALFDIFKKETRIDVVVNNAAIISNQKIGMISKNEMEKMFQVNVFAVVDIIQTVSRLMARNHYGSIINIASITGVVGSPGQVAYSSSKGAIISLTKSAAKELANLGIRVNAVAPGIVKTERFEELYQNNLEQINLRIEKIAIGRLGTPEDIANACVFFATDQSSYISGQILGVDGCATI